jgi:hypothetical protein
MLVVPSGGEIYQIYISLRQNGFFAILNEVKDLGLLKHEILRDSQNDLGKKK